ncbi:Na(+)/citrate cotransporter-like [Oppia nitens]|uniref:Na(+)/citrate cotransporter-like n=1 Tax=Oppia nitens TaxID=1686743 RepID=UPI0023DA620E|nr:Na(+)/citrate cotransporter-like [Oppia nitens]
MFTILLMLWFFRDPDFFKGWAPALYPKSSNYISDATAAMLIVCLMFLIPANPRDLVNSPPLMTWKAVQRKVPWGVFLLMGGALAMSSGIKKSGLSEIISTHLRNNLKNLSPIILQIIVSIICMFFTEVSNNAATSSIFLPIVKQLAESLGLSPLKFMLPVTVVSSFAFMFPAGSPSNAIVYEAANLKVYEMAIPGVFCKFICLSIVILSSNTWAHVVYNMVDIDIHSMNNTVKTIYELNLHG